MQNLNDRLATYLEKVRSLEQANSKIELQIKNWNDKNSGTKENNYDLYYKVIEDLKDKILNSTLDNARIVLQIDNAKLAAEDFRVKFESEKMLRTSVERDVAGLRKLIDDLSLIKADLEIQIESIQEDLLYLKKNHEDEIGVIRKQAGGSVSVEVDAAPSVDLAKVLEEMRIQCEKVVQKNKQETEQHYGILIEEVNRNILGSANDLETQAKTIKEIKLNIQNLELERQAEISKKDSLITLLENINNQYAAELLQIQNVIKNIEDQLSQIRTDITHHSQEYELLLNVKIRLEHEIETYRRLLDGDFASFIEKEEQNELARSRNIKTIVEEIVDGKVVSSQIQNVVVENVPNKK
ncbi:hypothetical protein GDO86_014242 [Hymenochirus boettgeri]|uniref:IF rod domain-containing protein n=1 Tax=Hymenochirus boettgeri TaxID=247094 RepID=A0A8T2JTS8_9PIPI|nr:hypothetical protein GDO86_014242 [Hymenochirus boettgeri]